MRDRSLLVGSLTVIAAAAGFGLLRPLARFAYDRPAPVRSSRGGVAPAAILLDEAIQPIQAVGGPRGPRCRARLQRSMPADEEPGRNASALAGAVER